MGFSYRLLSLCMCSSSHTHCQLDRIRTFSSIGLGDWTDAMAVAQTGRSSVSIEQDPVQYGHSCARVKAAIAAHETALEGMDEMAAAMVNGHLFFAEPTPSPVPTFMWATPVVEAAIDDSSDASRAGSPAAVVSPPRARAAKNKCSECGADM